jgi:polyphosphate kinase
MPGIKVHAKLALVVRDDHGEQRRCAYLSTGNFNERTARIYADYGLLTAHPEIVADVEQVFAVLDGRQKEPACVHLKVAPFSLRRFFCDAVDTEIMNARAGRPAWIRLKMNALEDEKMIEKLYEASEAGVSVDLVVRGICRLVSGKKGLSENIRVTSIVDRFLEHARSYSFCNAGAPVTYLSSADWMKRNLNRRIEVAFPILDADLRRELDEFAALQARDNRKARVIDPKLRNKYVSNEAEPCRAQIAAYSLLASRLVGWRALAASTESPAGP